MSTSAGYHEHIGGGGGGKGGVQYIGHRGIS